MGWEIVQFKGKSVELNNQAISWLQKFIELFLSKSQHPIWFHEVLDDLHGNFHVPHGKYFFDEEIIGDSNDRLRYCIEMLDQTISKMKSISKKEFFEFIKEDLSDSWCDISNEFYNEKWLSDDKNYQEQFIGSLEKIRAIMLE